MFLPPLFSGTLAQVSRAVGWLPRDFTPTPALPSRRSECRPLADLQVHGTGGTGSGRGQGADFLWWSGRLWGASRGAGRQVEPRVGGAGRQEVESRRRRAPEPDVSLETVGVFVGLVTRGTHVLLVTCGRRESNSLATWSSFTHDKNYIIRSLIMNSELSWRDP